MINLPHTIHVEISKFLPLITIGRLAKTCNSLHHTYTSEIFWKYMLQQDGECVQDGAQISESISAKEYYKGYKLWIMEQTSSSWDPRAGTIHNPNGEYVGLNSYILTQLTSSFDLTQHCKLVIPIDYNSVSSCPGQIPTRVKQVAGNSGGGCFIDISDNFWFLYFNPYSKNLCCYKTPFKAKSIASSYEFCIFVDKNDNTVKLYNMRDISPFNPTDYSVYGNHGSPVDIIMCHSVLENGKTPVKAFCNEGLDLHVNFQIFAGRDIFGVLVDRHRIFIYIEKSKLIQSDIIISGFDFDVLEICLTRSHLIVLDTENRVWTQKISAYDPRLGSSNQEGGFSPLLSGNSHVKAKRIAICQYKTNFILINFDDTISRVLLDNVSFRICALKACDKRDKSSKEFSHPNTFTDSLNTGSTLVFKWDKNQKLAGIRNKYGVGWAQLKVKSVNFNYNHLWIIDVEDRLWCFNKNLTFGSLIPHLKNISKVSCGLFLQRLR